MSSSTVVRTEHVVRQVEGFRAQWADLYLPGVGASPRAVCVYLHGGGWRVGSRRAGPGPLGPTSGRLFSRMADAGVAVVSSDYRLSGEAKFPAQLDDVVAVCAWASQTCEATKGLPLVLFGVSAGGNLALLAGMRLSGGESPNQPRAVAAWYPVADLLAMPTDLGADPSDIGTREAGYLGAAAQDVADVAAAASPVTAVHAAAPPVLLLHGDADTAVPIRQSERMVAALQTVGTQVTLEPIAGYDHMFRGMPDADVEALVDRTVSFLLGGSAVK